MPNDNIHSLSIDQIAAILEENKKLKKEVSSLKQKNTKKDKKINKLEMELRETHKELQKALKKIDLKNFIIKKQNHDKFYSKKENSEEDIIINEAEANATKIKRGRKKGSKNFENIDLESLVTKTVINDTEKVCSNCNGELNKIKEEISYKIEVVPAKYNVTKIITPVYVCKKCGKIFQAPSTSVYNHSSCTPSLAANIIEAKYDLGVPLYRYSKYLNDRGICLSTACLSNYVLATDEILRPYYDVLYSSLVNCSSKVIFVDETPLRVIDYTKENKKNGYIFAYVSSFYDNPIYLYSFNKTRETEETKMLLKGYKGYLVCDGYAGYNDVASNDIKIQRCFVHIRRYFYDIVKTLSAKEKINSVAYNMVCKIDRLFHEEGLFVENKLGPDEIYNKRKEKEYLAILNDIYDYLHSIEAEDGTPLYKAVQYFKKVEVESKTFLLDGHIPLSNNICERSIKPFTILRRNFLFAKTENGAKASARIFSIMQTAKTNGLVPELYLKYIIESIGKVPIDNLLPWSKELPTYLKEIELQK